MGRQDHSGGRAYILQANNHRGMPCTGMVEDTEYRRVKLQGCGIQRGCSYRAAGYSQAAGCGA